MKGLAPHTLQVFEAVSKLDCIKSYLLVGGTALSLQMGTRQNAYSGGYPFSISGDIRSVPS